ncbi:MaoC family dehydratase [Burkholderia plantarii]|uniref:MaoC domain protein n=1 Tax=Burkholderia plantarii TaxID=41899 RepID=A0A0B6RZH2_BURPL|nr:MaoC family dehydratase [Burkholderia plantarii]AJK46470.1 MaoC domain protein [Burkholderia plantarii]
MNESGGYDIEDLAVGMSERFVKTLTEHDVVLFATATGDHNPVHLDDDYARGTRFGGRIVHGMLSASVISAALASRLPGPGTIYLSQNLHFRRPVKPGETLSAIVTILELQPRRQRAVLATVCEVDGRVVVEGEAVVMPTSRAPAAAGAARRAPPLAV